jgi:uncharacterized membrane protein
MTTTSELTRRLDDFARRLAGLERELDDLRRLARAHEAGETPVAAAPVPPPPPPPPPSEPAPLRPPPPPRQVTPAWDERLGAWLLDHRLTVDALFGARALAWAGGFVTLLGILFFFVLAVNRGWIGPAERVGLGAFASLLAFAAGVWLRRAYGGVHSAYAAAGAGISGGYATLLAATALYDLVSRPVALLLAAGIAGVATITALAWSSELLAGLGLIGAVLAPAAIALQDGDWSPVGTGFAALMFAATGAVAVARRWQSLLAVGLLASLPQVAGLVAEAHVTDWSAVAVAAAFWLLYSGAGLAFQLRLERDGLASLPSTLVLLGGVVAGLSGVRLFEGQDEGWALFAVAAVEALGAAVLFVRPHRRELSAFVALVALAVGAVSVALLLSGPALTVAWAAEAAVLAWLARRAGELRYQLVALLYLAAAAVHALFWEAPLAHLYRATGDPADGIAALLALVAGASVFARYARPWDSEQRFGGVFAIVAPVLAGFRNAQPLWRALTGWAAGLAALYAGSLGVLGVLQLGQWLAPDDAESVLGAFEWAHVGVTGLWGLAGVGLLVLGHRIPSLQIRVGGLAWLGAVLLEAAFFDLSLADEPRGYAFLVAGAALGLGALLDRLALVDAPAFGIVATFVLASIAFAVAGVVQLLEGDTESFALLGVAALYAVVAVLVRGDRDLGTVFWAPALAVAAWAASELLSDTWLVLAWAAAAAALAALANRVGERRLELGAVAFLALAALHTLGLEAPPTDLFDANRHPEDGVPALVLSTAAAAVLGYYSRVGREWRMTAFGASALLGIYAGSLTILGLAELVGNASVATDFQRGHSAVSAFWGAIGLVALWVGLRRGAQWLRLAGFALFGLALAKLFLYDLAFLSSITRAFSFLAVGAVLLFGGFLVQKLGAERDSAIA